MFGAREVIRIERHGGWLLLETPSIDYVLKRFPYSELSLHAWYPHSIEDLAGGRMVWPENHGSYLLFEKDQKFSFFDSDREMYGGHVELVAAGSQSQGRLTIAYSPESLERIEQRSQRGEHAVNAGWSELARQKVGRAYAQEFRWESVEHFRVIESSITQDPYRVAGEVLELSAPARIYRFVAD